MLASYRVPTSDVIKESYPLPPYSSVIGMVHVACGFTEYQPMKISVQGRTSDRVREVCTRYEFNRSMSVTYTKKKGKQVARQNVVFQSESGQMYGLTRGAGQIELLADVELVVHIVPEDDKMIDVIADGLRQPQVYPSLGRWEDIVRIDEVSVCELTELCIDGEYALPYDAYVPEEQVKTWERYMCRTMRCTSYRLGKVFRINAAKGTRKWMETVYASHLKQGARICGVPILVDATEALKNTNALAAGTEAQRFTPVFLA